MVGLGWGWVRQGWKPLMIAGMRVNTQPPRTRAARCRGCRPQRRCGSTGWGASPCGGKGGRAGEPAALQSSPDGSRARGGGRRYPRLTGTRSKPFKCSGCEEAPNRFPGRQQRLGGAAGGAGWRQAAAAPRLASAAAPAHLLSSRKSYALAVGSAIAAARQSSSAARQRRRAAAMRTAIRPGASESKTMPRSAPLRS